MWVGVGVGGQTRTISQIRRLEEMRTPLSSRRAGGGGEQTFSDPDGCQSKLKVWKALGGKHWESRIPPEIPLEREMKRLLMSPEVTAPCSWSIVPITGELTEEKAGFTPLTCPLPTPADKLTVSAGPSPSCLFLVLSFWTQRPKAPRNSL